LLVTSAALHSTSIRLQPLCLLFSVSLSRLLPLTPSVFISPTPPPATSTLSLHDALPISTAQFFTNSVDTRTTGVDLVAAYARGLDRKSTRLNSSHGSISYAVFCLKKKKTNKITLMQSRQRTRQAKDSDTTRYRTQRQPCN